MSTTERRCNCTDPFALHSLQAQLSNHRVVAYMRADNASGFAQQKKIIDDFCQLHGYKVISRHYDFGSKPLTGLHEAIADLQYADALVTSDLQRLVVHPEHRDRDLRPLLHQFLCEHGKHLIAIAEGINTATQAGQMAAMEFITQAKDADTEPSWFAR